jgi:aryl-alcohol dehydrogenase-like predicted oxidoreductase
MRTLGPSAIEVSDLCMGCWAIGGPFWDRGGWMGYGDVDDAESLRALRRAHELGVNFYDTADVYGCGHSERLLGEAFGGRDDVVISDRFGFTFDEASRRVTGIDVSAAGIRAACEASLRRLRREVIDVYGLHLWDHPVEQADEVIQTLDALVDEGKIRGYCWLTDDIQRVRAIARGRHCVAAPQLLNVLEHDPQLLDLCEQLGLAACARRPLGMGLLTGKFTAAARFAENDMRRRFGWDLAQGKQARALQQLERIRSVLTRDGRTLAQGALGWIWARSPVALPSPGFKTVAQVEENVGALRYGPLDAAQMQEIEALLRPA